MTISLKKVAIAVISTTILTAIMLAITANGVLAVTLFPLSMLLFLFIFGVTGQINLWVKVTKVVAVVASIIALTLCAKYFKVEAQEPELVSDSVVQTEPTNPVPEDIEGNNQDTTEGMTGVCNCGCPGCICNKTEDVNSNAGKVSSKGTKKTTGKGTKNPFGDEIKTSYGGDENATDKTVPTGKSKVEGDRSINVPSNSEELPEDQKQQIEKDKKDGKVVITHPSGVITSSDEKTKKDEDNTPNNPNLDTSNTDKASTTPEKPKDPSNSKPSELPDDELDKYKPSTPPTEEKKPEDKPNNNEEENKGEKPKLVPATIRVDSKEAYVGDSIQFFVFGDIQSVEGYSGVTVDSIKNGTITITAPDVAQTITITVIGKDGSRASASIDVKKIGDPVKEEEKPQTPTESEPVKVPEEKPAPEPEKPETKPSNDDKTNNQTVTDNKDKGSNESEPKSNPVSIAPIGGSTATAGDCVQFKISGDVASIEGTSGFQTSQSNGVLNVQTQEGVATVIDITVKGVDGSQASASVTVNCVMNNNG